MKTPTTPSDQSRVRRLVMPTMVFATLATAAPHLFSPLQNAVFAKNYFSGNWSTAFPIGPSMGLLALSSSLVGYVFSESIWTRGRFLQGVFLLALLVLALANSTDDSWKDKTFSSLICIQVVHGVILTLLAVHAMIRRFGQDDTRVRHSIRQLMMATFVVAVAIWTYKIAQPHLAQVLLLKYAATFNYWVLIVGSLLALNTMAWRLPLQMSRRRHRWTIPAVSAFAVLLGIGAGVVYLSINPLWDTSMSTARYAVHIGFACCFLFQGATIYLLDFGIRFLSTSATPKQEATSRLTR